jgi:hypothetical protein
MWSLWGLHLPTKWKWILIKCARENTELSFYSLSRKYHEYYCFTRCWQLNIWLKKWRQSITSVWTNQLIYNYFLNFVIVLVVSFLKKYTLLGFFLLNKYSLKKNLLFCWVGGTLWHLQKFLQCIKYILLWNSVFITAVVKYVPSRTEILILNGQCDCIKRWDFGDVIRPWCTTPHHE